MEDSQEFTNRLEKKGVLWSNVRPGQVVRMNEHGEPIRKVDGVEGVGVGTGDIYIPMTSQRALPTAQE